MSELTATEVKALDRFKDKHRCPNGDPSRNFEVIISRAFKGVENAYVKCVNCGVRKNITEWSW